MKLTYAAHMHTVPLLRVLSQTKAAIVEGSGILVQFTACRSNKNRICSGVSETSFRCYNEITLTEPPIVD